MTGDHLAELPVVDTHELAVEVNVVGLLGGLAVALAQQRTAAEGVVVLVGATLHHDQGTAFIPVQVAGAAAGLTGGGQATRVIVDFKSIKSPGIDGCCFSYLSFRSFGNSLESEPRTPVL